MQAGESAPYSERVPLGTSRACLRDTRCSRLDAAVPPAVPVCLVAGSPSKPVADSVRFLTLRYFNEVAKLGSIRKAADRLHVAPSAVSRQIAQLEHELDAVLFERSKSGVRLTAAGEVLARQSHRVFRDIDRARSGIDDLRGLRRGEVNLWVIEGFVRGLLPTILAGFQRRYPDVSFKIQTASTIRSSKLCWKTRPISGSLSMRPGGPRSKPSRNSRSRFPVS